MPLRKLAGASLLACMIAACGGGSDDAGDSTPAPVTLAASAGATYALAGGDAVPLSATVSEGSAVSWQLAAGSPGSLSATSGTAVRYQPPSGGVTTATPVTVNATAGGVTKAVTITLHPDPGTPRLELIAGDDGGSGVIDGRGTQARFSTLRDVAIGPDGSLLVTEAQALRSVTADGTVTTLARTEMAGSVAPSASGLLVFTQADAAAGTVAVRRLNADLQPTTFATLQIAQLDELRLYGAAGGKLFGVQHERIVVITAAGGVTPLVGSVTGAPQPTPVDGPAASARFRHIKAIAGDQQGNLYVIDDTLVRKVGPDGTVTTLAGSLGSGLPQDGTGTQARFLAPFSLAVDRDGNVLVLDTLSGSAAIALRKVTPAGVVTSTTLADGTARQLVGNGGQRVMVVRSAQIDVLGVNGTSTPFAGKEHDSGSDSVDGTGSAARFSPAAYLMTADPQGNLYVVDTVAVGNHGDDVPGLTLRKVTQAGVTTTFLKSSLAHVPTGIVSDGGGNLYVSDRQVSGWATPQKGGGAIYRITPQGAISLLAGSGDQTDTKVDGTGAAARFILPTLVGIDAEGNLYATDRVSVNGTGVGVPVPVRKITPAGVVTTVTALPANLGTVTDAKGNVYRADVARSVVYRSAPGGTESIVAGALDQPFTYLGGLPGRLEHPASLVATGPFSFAMLSGGAVVRLVVPH